MKDIFFISDTHFGHANALTFKRKDGSPLRSFSCVEEMDEHMVTCWNSVVKPNDRIYHCGDVVINKNFLHILDRLNGKKVLIMGNHDIFGHQAYLQHFEDIRAYKVMPKQGIIASHIPVHTDSLYRFPTNIHGHLHADRVPDASNPHKIDNRYVNVCVESVNYTPVHLDEILARM